MGARSERASSRDPGRRKASPLRPDVPPSGQRSNTIVVGLSRSARSWEALAWAAAEAHDRCCTLRIIHAARCPPLTLNSYGALTVDLVEAALRAGELVMDEARNQALSIAPALRIDTIVELGEPASAILRHIDGDVLVVLGRRRCRRRSGWLSSLCNRSIVRRVARRTRCPVAVAGLHDDVAGPSVARVVALLDSRTEFRPTLEFAFDAAQRRRLGVTVIRSSDPTQAMGIDLAERTLERYRRAFPAVDVRETVLAEPMGPAGVAQARGAAIVAVGGSLRRPARRALFTRSAGSVLGPVVLVRTGAAGQ